MGLEAKSKGKYFPTRKFLNDTFISISPFGGALITTSHHFFRILHNYVNYVLFFSVSPFLPLLPNMIPFQTVFKRD